MNANIVACAAGICNTNGQATMANSAPVALASNRSVADPCTYKLKQSAPINLTASGKIVRARGAQDLHLRVSSGDGHSPEYCLVEGSGSVCATNIFGLAGAQRLRPDGNSRRTAVLLVGMGMQR